MTERRELPYAWADVKLRLQRDIFRLLARFGINERERQGVVTPRNPTRNDRRPGSFVIRTAVGSNMVDVGGWKDFATGDKGDVFDLIAYLGGLQGKMDVYWWALDFLGLGKGEVRTKAQAQLDRERFGRDRLAREKKYAEAEEARSETLFRLWLSLPPIAGTPAERYLRDVRRIPLERLAHQPGALRWAEVVDYIDPETGEVITWRHCMVSAMTRGKKLSALHRTYLKPDGSGKAERTKAKMMIGPASGAAIRLSAGPSGLSPTKAAEKGRRDPLAIGEGIETCLTVACARPDYRVWAAGSLSLMGLVDWPECASAVVLLQDNDWGSEAREAFKRVEAHWRGLAKGRPVVVAASAVGSDFNDWVKG